MRRKVETIRLNKLIADRSEYSRREADELIKNGFVKVDGEVVTNPGTAMRQTPTLASKTRG